MVAAATSAVATAASRWDLTTSTIMLDGAPAVLRGVCVSCLEYTCDGAGTDCAALLLSRDVAAITALLLDGAAPVGAAPSSSDDGAMIAPADAKAYANTNAEGTTAPHVVPTVRLALTAEYWLDDAGACVLDGRSYADYVGAVTEAFTASGGVVILDLVSLESHDFTIETRAKGSHMSADNPVGGGVGWRLHCRSKSSRATK